MIRSDNTDESDLYLPSSAGWTRRRFLSTAGMGVGGAALALAGCGSSSNSAATSGSASGSAGTPRRGGTLNYGCQGGTSSDTLDGQNALQTTDFARSYALYDPLVRIDNSGHVQLWLAESITPNADATEWTIKIPAGVTTHKGKRFTSKDVLFSLQRIIANKFMGSHALGPIDFAGCKAVDATTVLVRYKRPFSVFPQALAPLWQVMVPEGFDPKHPDGTGPFMYKQFTPGATSTFVRNPNYWRTGKPYLDSLVVTNINDQTAQVNALQSGQVDLINFLSASSVPTLQSGGAQVYIKNKTGNAGLISMRVDTAPFNDVRVRQAFRLIVDRKAMLREVFGGYGAVGDDVFGLVDPLYDSSLPQRHQDIPKAKALLAAAGHTNLQVPLVTTASGPGQVEVAQVFATQAQAAGVTVNVINQSPTQYFAKSYDTVPFSQDYWIPLPYFTLVSLALIPPTPFNPSHQNDAEYNALFEQALSTTDEAKKTDLAHRMQMIEYTRGGLIIPYYFPAIDASSKKVHGVEPSGTGIGSGGLYWSDVWVEG